MAEVRVWDGIPIDTGLFPDIPPETYHDWDAASFSRLKVLREKTPAHLRHMIDNPREATPAMAFGSAVHCAVLEPGAFPNRYYKGPDGVWTAKLKAQMAEQDSRIPLKPDDYQHIIEIQDRVRNHPSASRMLGGESEVSAVWDLVLDDVTGLEVRCKARFDHLASHVGAVVDLKSTADASPGAFPRSIYNLGYHIQGAHYRAGARAHGLEVSHFIIIAVEKEPPYGVAIYRLTSGTLDAGDDELGPLLRTYAECHSADTWPGYDVEPRDIQLPPFAYEKIAAKLWEEETNHVG